MHHSEITKLTTLEKDAVLALLDAGVGQIGEFWKDNDRAFGIRGTAEGARRRFHEIIEKAEEDAETLVNMIGSNAAVALASATAMYKWKCTCDGFCYHMATG